MDSRWTALDDAIIGCLPGEGPLEPVELARLLGISEEAAASLMGPVVEEKAGIRRVGAGVRPRSERPAA